MGNLLFLNGMLPVVDHKPKYFGRLGKELNTEAGRDAVYTAALNVLAAAKQHLCSLDRVTRVVRLGVFLATSGDFFDQPKVTFNRFVHHSSRFDSYYSWLVLYPQTRAAVLYPHPGKHPARPLHDAPNRWPSTLLCRDQH